MAVDKVIFTAGLTATPYTAGDVVGGVLHFKGIPANMEVLLTSFLLQYYVTANPSGAVTSLTLHLYNERPGSALADNAVFDIPSGDRANHIGSIALGTIADKGSTLEVELDAQNKHIKTGSEGLFGYLTTTAAYTPAGNAETYAMTVGAVPF